MLDRVLAAQLIVIAGLALALAIHTHWGDVLLLVQGHMGHP